MTTYMTISLICAAFPALLAGQIFLYYMGVQRAKNRTDEEAINIMRNNASPSQRESSIEDYAVSMHKKCSKGNYIMPKYCRVSFIVFNCLLVIETIAFMFFDGPSLVFILSSLLGIDLIIIFWLIGYINSYREAVFKRYLETHQIIEDV